MNRFSNQRWAVIWLAIGNFIWLPSLDCWSHPFHFTTAEMEYNARTARFEVSMRVLASDLESALARIKSDIARHERDLHATSPADTTSATRETGISDKTNLACEKSIKHEASLSVRVGESTPNTEDQAVLRYLERNFRIQAKPNKATSAADIEAEDGLKIGSASGQPTVIHWVGKETDQSWVWLYFEVEPPASENGWMLTNQLFMDLNELQINTCVIRMDAQRLSVKTEAKNCTVELPLIFRK